MFYILTDTLKNAAMLNSQSKVETDGRGKSAILRAQVSWGRGRSCQQPNMRGRGVATCQVCRILDNADRILNKYLVFQYDLH